MMCISNTIVDSYLSMKYTFLSFHSEPATLSVFKNQFSSFNAYYVGGIYVRLIMLKKYERFKLYVLAIFNAKNFLQCDQSFY